MKTVLFVYDFPHLKSQEFIFRMILENKPIDYVVAAPRVNLNLPKSSLRTGLHYSGLNHPRKICRRFGIPYHVFPHNSQQCEKFLHRHHVDLGIIAGARILKQNIIDSFGLGILNLHPGYLPHVRGLDTLQWSICLDRPIAITAHLIDKKIDAGKLLFVKMLDLLPDDTLLDISHRILEVQPDILIESLQLLDDTVVNGLSDLSLIKTDYNSSMPPDLERRVPELFPGWLKIL